MKVMFADCVAQKPYTLNTLRSYAMGGSEATVLRIANGLSKLPGYSSFLFQACDPHRTEMNIDGIFHCNGLTQLEPDVLVHVRTAQFLASFRELYPRARHILFLEDFGVEPEMAGAEIVCVSNYHTHYTERKLAELGLAAKSVCTIYNPVVTYPVTKPPEKVKGRLGFFSSPHKGLEETVRLFHVLKKDRPELELVVGNPGYLADVAPEGVRFFGQLPHHRVMEELSKCQLLFYPNTVFAETMGIVMAEANAVGTPVLAHDFGAAKEVLYRPTECQIAAHQELNYVVDCTRPELVESCLKDILAEKRLPVADPRFALDNIIDQWRTLLEEKPLS